MNCKGILLILVICLQSGCLALGGGYLGNDKLQPAFVTSKRATYAKFRYGAYDVVPYVPRKENAIGFEPILEKVISKNDLVAAWGPPDEQILDEGRQLWVYRDGLRWNGVFIFPGIILPIPLVIPVGWNTFTVEFQEDTVRNIVAVLNEVKGGGACTFVFVHGGAGCRFGQQFRRDFSLKHSRIMNPNPRDLLGSYKERRDDG